MNFTLVEKARVISVVACRLFRKRKEHEKLHGGI